MDKTRTYNHFFNIPEVLEQRVKEDVKKFGTVHVNWMLDVAPIQRMVETEMKENKSRADIFFQLATNVLYQLSSKDILPPHNVIAREAISETEGIKYEDVESEAVNTLAFEVLKVCNDLKTTFMGDYTPLHDEKGYVINEFDSNKGFEDLTASKDGMLWMDHILLDYLSKIGNEGKKAKKEITKSWKGRYQKFVYAGKKDMASAFKIWVVPEHTFHPIYLNLIAQIVYKDVVRDKILFEKGKHSALTRGVLTSVIMPQITGRTKIERVNNTVIAKTTDGKYIVSCANLDAVLLDSIYKGLKQFGSIHGHRLLRFEVDMGHYQWIKKLDDPRYIKIEGGYGELCRLVGCSNTSRNRQILKSILEAQAHGNFSFPDGSIGNMLQLNRIENEKYSDLTEIQIVLGSVLMPNYSNILKDPRDRRLIPITKLPDFTGRANTHAQQATLQLNVLKEFSDRSPELAEQGYLVITDERWEQLGIDSELNKKTTTDAVRLWSEPNIVSQFLDSYENEYKIAKPFQDASDFLIEQGNYRLKRSKEGKKKRNYNVEKKKKL